MGLSVELIEVNPVGDVKYSFYQMANFKTRVTISCLMINWVILIISMELIFSVLFSVIP